MCRAPAQTCPEYPRLGPAQGKLVIVSKQTPQANLERRDPLLAGRVADGKRQHQAPVELGRRLVALLALILSVVLTDRVRSEKK